MKINWLYHLLIYVKKDIAHKSQKNNCIWVKSFVSNQQTALSTATSAQFTELFA